MSIDDPRITPDLALEVETQIARALGLRREFAQARAQLDGIVARSGARSRHAKSRTTPTRSSRTLDARVESAASCAATTRRWRSCMRSRRR